MIRCTYTQCTVRPIAIARPTQALRKMKETAPLHVLEMCRKHPHTCTRCRLLFCIDELCSISRYAHGQGNCEAQMADWMAIGANTSLSLQILGTAFRRVNMPATTATTASRVVETAAFAASDNIARVAAAEAAAAVTAAVGADTAACGTCNVTAGHDAISHGIIAPPIPTANTTACCAACKDNPRCEAFVMGPCRHGDPGCAAGAPSCFLVDGFAGLRPSADRATGCIRGAPAPPAPPSPSVDINNTVAAFLIARGPSAMLELPVLGAYEDMTNYVLSPLLDMDYGIPLGPGRKLGGNGGIQGASGQGGGSVFTREYTRASVTLNCSDWTSVIRLK